MALHAPMPSVYVPDRPADPVVEKATRMPSTRARRTRTPAVPVDPPQVPGPPSTTGHYYPPYLAVRTPDRKPPRSARKPLPGQEPLF